MSKFWRNEETTDFYEAEVHMCLLTWRHNPKVHILDFVNFAPDTLRLFVILLHCRQQFLLNVLLAVFKVQHFKRKCKSILIHVIKVCRESRGIAPSILRVSTGWQ